MSADALSSAKAALAHANKTFPSPASSEARSHEYSHAPYSLVGEVKKKLQEPIDEYHKAVSDVESKGIAQGVENRKAQMDAASK